MQTLFQGGNIYKVSQGWRRTMVLPVNFLMQSHRGGPHWCNVNKQVNDSRKKEGKKKKNGVNLISCPPLSEWDFRESWGRSPHDLLRVLAPSRAAEQRAAICTKKTLFPFEAPNMRAGLSFNCRLRFPTWIQFTQQPTVLMPQRTLTLNAISPHRPWIFNTMGLPLSSREAE